MAEDYPFAGRTLRAKYRSPSGRVVEVVINGSDFTTIAELHVEIRRQLTEADPTVKWAPERAH